MTDTLHSMPPDGVMMPNPSVITCLKRLARAVRPVADLECEQTEEPHFVETLETGHQIAKHKEEKEGERVYTFMFDIQLQTLQPNKTSEKE